MIFRHPAQAEDDANIPLRPSASQRFLRKPARSDLPRKGQRPSSQSPADSFTSMSNAPSVCLSPFGTHQVCACPHLAPSLYPFPFPPIAGNDSACPLLPPPISLYLRAHCPVPRPIVRPVLVPNALGRLWNRSQGGRRIPTPASQKFLRHMKRSVRKALLLSDMANAVLQA